MKRDIQIQPVPINTLLEEWIRVMRRVARKKRRFDTSRWQSDSNGKTAYEDDVKHTETDIHQCGFAACGGGYLAVSDFWASIGGHVDPYNGAPAIGSYSGSKALFQAVINGDKATIRNGMEALVTGSRLVFDYPQTKTMDSITARQFLDALIRFRNTGSPYLSRKA